jgi:hypothetical protein
MRKYAIAAVLTVSGLLAISWAAVTALAHTASKSRPAAPATRQPSMVSSALSARFVVLRTESRASTVPDAVAKFAENPYAAAHYAPNAALARAATPDGGDRAHPWYVLPGDNSVCLHVGEAGSCASLAEADAGKLVMMAVDPELISGGASNPSAHGSVRFMGVAPDGVNRVEAVSRSGERVARPVVDNVYDLQGTDLTGVILRRDDGSTIAIPFLR